MEVIVVPPGEALATAWDESVHALFRSGYHRYHYLDSVTRADRYRFLATHGRSVAGFARTARD
jgi:hypothetical protein